MLIINKQMSSYKQGEITRHSSNSKCYFYLFNIEEFLLSARILLHSHWRFNLVLDVISSLYGITTPHLTTLVLISSDYQGLNCCTGSHISATEPAQVSSSPKKLIWLSESAKKQKMSPSGTLGMHWHWASPSPSLHGWWSSSPSCLAGQVLVRVRRCPLHAFSCL